MHTFNKNSHLNSLSRDTPTWPVAASKHFSEFFSYQKRPPASRWPCLAWVTCERRSFQIGEVCQRQRTSVETLRLRGRQEFCWLAGIWVVCLHLTITEISLCLFPLAWVCIHTFAGAKSIRAEVWNCVCLRGRIVSSASWVRVRCDIAQHIWCVYACVHTWSIRFHIQSTSASNVGFYFGGTGVVDHQAAEESLKRQKQ